MCIKIKYNIKFICYTKHSIPILYYVNHITLEEQNIRKMYKHLGNSNDTDRSSCIMCIQIRYDRLCFERRGASRYTCTERCYIFETAFYLYYFYSEITIDVFYIRLN